MKTNFTKLIAIGAICLSPSLLLAHSVIKGKIVDKDGGSSLAGAKISLKNEKFSAVANKNGEFTLLNVPAGEHELVISYLGYNKINQKINTKDEETSLVNIDMEAITYTSGGVVVVGDQLKGQAKALNQQKESKTISNVISADQTGKFPDANIGDAMKRISGVAVQYDQGEARFGLIRGAAPYLNSITINGDRTPSAEGETRVVQLDLVPSDMIQSIELNKALTPEMDGDAIGGSVNLVTKSSVNGTKLTINAGGGHNFLSNKPIWNLSGSAGTRIIDNKLGVTFSGSYNDVYQGSDNMEASWLEGPQGKAYLGDLQIRKYDIRRMRESYGGGLDYKIDANNTVYFNALYNHRNDWENRYRLRIRYDKGDATTIDGVKYAGLPSADGTVKNTQVIREVKGGINNDDNDKARLEDQRTFNFSLSGEHLLFNTLKMNWQGNWAKASEERPHERYLSYKYKKAGATQNISDESEPKYTVAAGDDLSKYALDFIDEQYQYTDEIDLNAKIDFELPAMEGEFSNKVKFGARIRNKDKKRDNRFAYYTPTGKDMANLSLVATKDMSDDNFLAGDYLAGRFATNEYLGDLNLDDASKFTKSDAKEEYAAANYKANEKIYAGYAQIDQNIGDNLSALFGVRIENTKVDYNANQLVFDENNKTNPYSITPTNGKKDYTNVLPALHLKYTPYSNLTLRAAWTNSIARPNYYQLAPFRSISLGDEELSEGNTNLKATTSMNFDLMADYYFESIGVVSAGVFYKKIDDFIYKNIVANYNDPLTNRTFKTYEKPENGANANLYGVEVAFQRQLDFLPGFLKGFGVYANYTFTNSEADGLKTPGRENEKVSLPGSAKHMLNASLSYEMSDFSARLSMNHTGDYVDEFGASEFYDRYYDVQTFLDFNASYEFIKGMSAYLDVNNITNQPLRYYQGKGQSDRVMQVEYYNRRVTFGLKYHF
jgi:TonB-dependent receptor